MSFNSNGDRDFKTWLMFFGKKKPSLTKFMHLIHKKDAYFLHHPLDVDFDDELYEKIRPGGFIEQDFQQILANENPKDVYYKTRLAICLTLGLDFSLIKNRIGEENFFSVLEKCLIDGHYEEYDINFEKLISLVITKYHLPRTSLIDISFLRGVNLGSRYPSDEEEKLLKKKIFTNKIKIFLGI
jgi:hypothetical protein